jgi:glycosyltransferase involved in cell wall biosynthesis
MKIAQIVCTFPPYRGGIGNVAYAWAKNLSKLRQDVTVFTPDYHGDKIISQDFSIVYLRPWLHYGNGAFLPQLLRLLPQYDIVHLHYPFFGSAEVVWLTKMLNKKKIKLFIHYHMDTSDLSLPAKLLSIPNNFIKSSLLNQALAITCASLDYVNSLSIVDYYKKHQQKFQEIPFGVDSENFKPNNDWLKFKDKIIFVGSLDSAHNFKGLDVLLHALTLINNQQIKLVVVGSGNLLPQYRKLSKQLQVGHRVEFAGAVSDDALPAYYQSADLLVLPSINQHEAFGLVLLEALASGLPVVASDLPGVRSVFTNGEQGYLARPRDADDLAKQINNVFGSRDQWQAMCQSARQLALSKYSWPAAASKLVGLYAKYAEQ